MKILIVNNSITYGGASKILFWLSEVLLKSNFEVSVCYFNDCSRIFPCGIKCFKLHNELYSSNFITRNTLGLFLSVKKLRSLLIKEKYDLIISFADHTLYSLFFAKIGLPVKILLSERMDPYSASLSDKIRHLLYCSADFYVFQTSEASGCFGKRIRSHSKIISNPVVSNKGNVWKYNDNEFVIISVGRLHITQKRQDILLYAYQKISKEYPFVSLWIVGSGKDENVLKRMTDKLGISEKVKFLGYQEDIPGILCKSNLFVLSSDFEGIPNALIEALQCRIPVISTDCSPGGAKLLLDNGKYGLLVERGKVEPLYHAIKKCLNKDTLNKMSIGEIGALDRFKEDVIAKQWVEWIKENMQTK